MLPVSLRTSSRKVVFFLCLLLFISSTSLYYHRARWSNVNLPDDPFPLTANLDLDQQSTSVSNKSLTCTSPTMPDPGFYPSGASGKGQSKAGWNELPALKGARIDRTTFRVGQGALTTYITSSYDPRRIKRAVVMVHGLSRASWNQQLYASLALDKASESGKIEKEEVLILAPHFFTLKDAGAFSTGHNQPHALVWRGVEWADGSPSVHPKGSTVGAFDALDAVIDHLLNVESFPQLNHIVIGGFSLGAQLVTRYATFRVRDPTQDPRLSYWISSPNSFVYLDPSRPYSTRNCPDFNQYKYGLEGELPPYLSNKGIRPTLEYLAPNLLNRRIAYCVGQQDLSAGSDVCAAAVQGESHLSKVHHWTEDYLPFLPGSTGTKGLLPELSTVDYIQGASHQDWKIVQSDCAIRRLFLEDPSHAGGGGGERKLAEQGATSGKLSATESGEQGQSQKGSGIKDRMKGLLRH